MGISELYNKIMVAANNPETLSRANMEVPGLIEECKAASTKLDIEDGQVTPEAIQRILAALEGLRTTGGGKSKRRKSKRGKSKRGRTRRTRTRTRTRTRRTRKIGGANVHDVSDAVFIPLLVLVAAFIFLCTNPGMGVDGVNTGRRQRYPPERLPDGRGTL